MCVLYDDDIYPSRRPLHRVKRDTTIQNKDSHSRHSAQQQQQQGSYRRFLSFFLLPHGRGVAGRGGVGRQQGPQRRREGVRRRAAQLQT